MAIVAWLARIFQRERAWFSVFTRVGAKGCVRTAGRHGSRERNPARIQTEHNTSSNYGGGSLKSPGGLDVYTENARGAAMSARTSTRFYCPVRNCTGHCVTSRRISAIEKFEKTLFFSSSSFLHTVLARELSSEFF